MPDSLPSDSSAAPSAAFPSADAASDGFEVVAEIVDAGSVPAGPSAQLCPIPTAAAQIRLNPAQPYLLICRTGPTFRVWAELARPDGGVDEVDLTANVGDLFVLGLQHNPTAVDPQSTLEGHRALLHGDDVNVGQLRVAGWHDSDRFHLVDFVHGQTHTFDVAHLLGALSAAVRHLIEEGVAAESNPEDLPD